MTENGLFTAPAKTVAGQPVVALGFSVDVAGGRLRCPPGKRAQRGLDWLYARDAAREAAGATGPERQLSMTATEAFGM
eukprot:6214313-Pleurochrysis_carterae.AAC.7